MDAHILRLDQYHRGPSPDAQVTLEITRGKVQQRLRPVSGRVFLIGTSSDCDLVLGDLRFPEVYAYLFVDGPQVTIRRLGAGPPLFVCGERIDRGELFQSDLVEFGPFELRIAIDAADHDDQGNSDHFNGLNHGGQSDHSNELLLEQDVTLTEDTGAAPAVLRFTRHSKSPA